MKTTNQVEAQSFLTRDITRVINGVLSQANSIFGFEPENCRDAIPDAETAISSYVERLAELIGKAEPTKEGAAEVVNCFNSMATYQRSLFRLEFEQSFSVGATVYVKMGAEVKAEKNAFVIEIALTAEVSASATSRNVAKATAFANLYSQAVCLASLVEGNGHGFARLYVEK